MTVADDIADAHRKEPVPLLSVIIPAYNAEDTLQDTLRSFERIASNNQHLIELIFVDDGSTDQTLNMLSAFKHDMPYRCTVLEGNHRGVSAARNLGLEAASGQWVMFLDADDELGADYLEILSRHKNCSSIGFSVKFRKGQQTLKVRKPPRIDNSTRLDRFTAENPLAICTLVFRREFLEANFDESLSRLEDWHFWSMNPRLFSKMVCEPKVIGSIVNIRGSSVSSN